MLHVTTGFIISFIWYMHYFYARNAKAIHLKEHLFIGDNMRKRSKISNLISGKKLYQFIVIYIMQCVMPTSKDKDLNLYKCINFFLKSA